NLSINLPTTNFAGLFGYTRSGSVIQNVGLVGGNVSGDDAVGGLVGQNSDGTVSNSYATGAVSGRDYVGGLVGINDSGSTVSSSCNKVSTTQIAAFCGEMGLNGGSTNSKSDAGGARRGDADVGGLAGDNDGTVSNSYATGAVSGTDNTVGGLVGYNNGVVSNG